MQLGRFYLGRGRPAEALAQFQEAARRRSSAVEPLIGQAEAYAALGKATEAVEMAEKVITAQREDADGYVFLGVIRERLGQPAEAAKAYRQALDREPRDLGASRALARLSARERNLGEATRLLTEAAAAHPGSALPWLDLAMIQEGAGNRGEALDAYRRALERDGRNAVILNNLAYLLGQDPQHLDEALGLAERAYQRVPRVPAIVDTLGWLLFQKGDLARAEKLLAQAAAALPKNARVRYHLGMTYAKLGKAGEARRELEDALRLKPFPEAEEARRTLNALP
jgi:Flp pilus assembly protein TadD